MAPLELPGLIKSYRSPDGELETILDIPHFELEAEEQVALARAVLADEPTGRGFAKLIVIRR